MPPPSLLTIISRACEKKEEKADRVQCSANMWRREAQCSADVHLNKKRKCDAHCQSLVKWCQARREWVYFFTAKAAGIGWHRMGSFTPFLPGEQKVGRMSIILCQNSRYGTGSI